MKIAVYDGNTIGSNTAEWIEKNDFFMPSSTTRHHLLKSSRGETLKSF